MVVDFIITFLYAFSLIFIAELGDKTQLVMFYLSSKGYNSRLLILGGITGFLIILFLGGAIALILSNFINPNWISLISGLVFLILGSYQLIQLLRTARKTTVKQSDITNNNQENEDKVDSNAFIIGFISIFSMELGDKTQLLTILLASASSNIIATLLGAWIALSLLAIIGVVAGSFISKKVPQKYLDYFTSILFIIIGLIVIIQIFIPL
ncbi:MAG: hypothetical protein GF317_00990 [Candidatus Lokiarchaeota archaeon]|nr:hypothetical protein [Candidatus Lokiarchaeota archaeon]MBD3198534.1 hypothetical protein [Candidatus Lokiarchaeota archaeon]